MKADYDLIIIGSGINSLVCAAIAAKRGFSVCVLERNDRLGGCIRTDALTLPGFVHDTLSGFHPLFVTSAGYRELRDDLAIHGLRYVNTTIPTAVVLSDGRSARLSTSRAENIRHFDSLHSGDGAAYEAQMRDFERTAAFTFDLLGHEMWSARTLWRLLSETRRQGPRGLLEYFGRALQTSRQWLNTHFGGEVLRGLLAPWILHTGLGPDSELAGFMNRLIAFTLEAAGMPVVCGGSGGLVTAFQSAIHHWGGNCRVDTHVAQILVQRNRAVGVLLADGKKLTAARAVVANVTPTQLYGSLLDAACVPPELIQASRAYRYGRADMQIHLALDAPLRWKDPTLAGAAMVHLTAGVDAIAGAISEAEQGFLPRCPTVVVGQPSSLDATRAPAGKAVVWLQLQELPTHIKGDAAGLIEVPADGRWGSATKEAYADRVLALLARHVEGLQTSILRRVILSPLDLEALNINLVGGDPYSGACHLSQSLFWRPFPSTVRHETPVRQLFHIGASTHPGPGLGGMSGYLVAGAL